MSKAALLAVSVLLHGAALLLFLRMASSGPDKDGPSSAMDVVWIRTPELAAPVKAAAPLVATARPVPKPLRPRPAPAVRVAIGALEAAPVMAAEAAPPVAAEKSFDRTAALQAARNLASEPDTARLATVGGQIEARRALSETEDEKLGRQIAGAKRSDCIGPNASGNLLSPLMWLLQKKGSGCKL